MRDSSAPDSPHFVSFESCRFSMKLSEVFTPDFHRTTMAPLSKDILPAPPNFDLGDNKFLCSATPILSRNGVCVPHHQHPQHQQVPLVCVPNPGQPLVDRLAESREQPSRWSGSRAAVTDVTFFVGRNRAPFIVSADTLKYSKHWSSLLEKGGLKEPVIIDCEESTFQHLVLILRYGSYEALPKMSSNEIFRLERELQCLGIDVPNGPKRTSSASAGPGCSKPSSSASYRVSHPANHEPPRPSTSRCHHQSISFEELPDLPQECKDSARLCLVASLDDDSKFRCPCTPKGQRSHWALSFYYRHTFCTTCGRCPTAMPSKYHGEMYLAAANHFLSRVEQKKPKWFIGQDNTTTLKFIDFEKCCSCPCNCSASGNGVWAISTTYSHAFCTHCGQEADARALILIVLTVRFCGRGKDASTSSTRTTRSEGALSVSGSPHQRGMSL